MKHFFILMVTLALVFTSCGREIVITGDEIQTDVFYARNDVRPFTGVCRIYYHGTSTVKEEFHYKKGIMNGDFISCFSDGTVRRKGVYSDGMLSGIMREWDEKGNLVLEASFVNDTLEGPFITKYADGNIKESGTYSKNIRIGEWIEH
jgi:antitoxin component YwqK of YwqJK toxin-antitoxin module